MRTSRSILVSLFITALFSISAFAQAEAPAKIGMIDTDAFYATTGGITKIANGYKTLEAEFKSDTTELENMAKRLQTLQTEVQSLQAKANDPNNKVPIDMNVAQAKVDEAQKLQRDLKFKDEDLKARFTKRQTAVLGPITQDVGKALGDFAKQKGYTLVLDSGKLFEAQVLIYQQETTDITKEFIQFYNARPAGTATSKP